MKGATPWPMAGPRDQDRHAAPAPPPRPTRGIARGPKGPLQPTPPPRTDPRAGGEAAPPPPPPPPPPAPTTAGEPQARPSAPPGPGGRPPLRGNGGAMRATAAGPAPANPRRRARATRTTEQEGGRAPHDPPVTTARSEVTEGGFQVRWGPQGGGPRAAPHPPHPGAALQPRPHARAGRERTGDTERARKEYHRPPCGTRAGRPRRDNPPPPPAPPAARQPRGPRPRPPEAEGMDPPRPRGEPECDPPPRPSRRLKWGPQRTSGPTPAHLDAAQIVPREAGWARTGMVWVATPPMDSRTPSDARFVAYPGKAARHLPREGVRRQQARGETCCPATR